MVSFARTAGGEVVYADDFDDQSWQAFKENYIIGELEMPCCSSPAIPKTSPNFLKFFAHYSNECASSEESRWHLQAKELFLTHLKQMNVEAFLEYSSKSKKELWKADIFFEFDQRKVAIELQHSYQHYRDYIKRQEKYCRSNTECYWVLFQPRYKTLCKSISKEIVKCRFKGKFPNSGFFPCIPELPVVWLDTAVESPVIKGAGLFNCSLNFFLEGIITRKFGYQDGIWKIRNTS